MSVNDQHSWAENSPSQQRPWWSFFSWADLLHVAVAGWLIFKQRMALSMMGITPGGMMLLASAGAVIFLTAWVRRASGRRQIGWWLLVSGLITLLMYADIMYFRQFGDLISVPTIKQIGQLSTVSGSVTALFRPADLLLWVDIPILLGLLFVPTRLGTQWFRPVRKWLPPAVALVGALIVGVVAALDPFLALHYYGHTMVGSRLGLLNYHAFDLGTYASRVGSRLTSNAPAVREVQDWFDQKRQAETPVEPTDPAGPLAAGAAEGKNVIMLQLESFQSFPLGLKIDGQEVTPNLNRLMAESLYFPNFYHQTGQGVTSDADLLANCSLQPLRTGAVYYDYAHNDFRCLPAILQENGYTTVAMQGMPADFWNLSAVYPRVGFQRYDSIRNYEYDEQVGIGLSDESFLRQSVDKLKDLQEPYYAFLVTLTSHGPFAFEDLPATMDVGELEGTMAGAYLNAIHYTDRAVGQFIDRLKAEGILDRAVLVVYGDHIGVSRHNDGMATLLKIPVDDQVAWTSVEKGVPLLIRLPEAAATGERPTVSGQADIAPTVAGLLALPKEHTYFLGRDLFATQKGFVPFYRGSAADDQHLYFSPDDSGAAGLCYDMKTGESLPLDSCKSLADQTAERLRVSSMIIERNLIPDLLAAE